jgi:hypothetical protein
MRSVLEADLQCKWMNKKERHAELAEASLPQQ